MKVTLELGGKSPVLIFDDANLDTAVLSAAIGIFAGSGQGCVCGSRIFVQRTAFDRVVEGIAAVGSGIQLDGPKDEGDARGGGNVTSREPDHRRSALRLTPALPGAPPS